MTRVYLWSSAAIIILSTWIINLSILYILLTVNKTYGILIAVTFAIRELATYNVHMTFQNLEKKNE